MRKHDAVPAFPMTHPWNRPTRTCQAYRPRMIRRERPGIVVLGCFGIGFVLGWKLKLW